MTVIKLSRHTRSMISSFHNDVIKFMDTETVVSFFWMRVSDVEVHLVHGSRAGLLDRTPENATDTALEHVTVEVRQTQRQKPKLYPRYPQRLPRLRNPSAWMVWIKQLSSETLS